MLFAGKYFLSFHNVNAGAFLQIFNIVLKLSSFSNLDDNDENEEDDGEDDDGDLDTSPSDQACKFLKLSKILYMIHLHITCNIV